MPPRALWGGLGGFGRTLQSIENIPSRWHHCASQRTGPSGQLRLKCAVSRPLGPGVWPFRSTGLACTLGDWGNWSEYVGTGGSLS